MRGARRRRWPRTARSRSTTTVTSRSTSSSRDHHLAAAFYRNTIVHYFIGALDRRARARARRRGDVRPGGRDRRRSGPRRTGCATCSSSTSSSNSATASARRSPRSCGRACPTGRSSSRAGVEPGVAARQDAAAARVRRAAPVRRGVPRRRPHTARPPARHELGRHEAVRQALPGARRPVAADKAGSGARRRCRSTCSRPAIQLVEHRKLTAVAPDAAVRRREFVDQLADINRRIDVVEQRTYDRWGRSLTEVTW